MENKITAVEWLVDEIKKMKIGNNQLLIYYEDLDYLIEKAKEMEKEQIIKAAQDNFYVGQDLANGYKIDWNSAEQYYNEEYNK